MTEKSFFKSLFHKNLDENLKTITSLRELDHDLESVVETVKNSLLQGGKILFCGNGGSAADSQHLAAEFIGRFKRNRKPLSALALTTDSSVITCIANDFSYDQVFSRQLYALGKKEDCLVAISTSGRSQSVINAVKTANDIGIQTIGLLGGNGGDLKEMCTLKIVVPSFITARIQEAHIFIGHAICEGVEEGLLATGFMKNNEASVS